MNLLGVVFRGAGIFLVKTGAEQAAKAALLYLINKYLSQWLANFFKGTVLPWFYATSEKLLLWLGGVLGFETAGKIRAYAKAAVKEVEETWTDAAKIRQVLRALEAQGLQKTLEQAKDKGWIAMKALVPASVLEMLDAARRSQAIDTVKASMAAEGHEVSASSIAPMVEVEAANLRGKALAERARAVFENLKSGEK